MRHAYLTLLTQKLYHLLFNINHRKQIIQSDRNTVFIRGDHPKERIHYLHRTTFVGPRTCLKLQTHNAERFNERLFQTNKCVTYTKIDVLNFARPNSAIEV